MIRRTFIKRLASGLLLPAVVSASAIQSILRYRTPRERPCFPGYPENGQMYFDIPTQTYQCWLNGKWRTLNNLNPMTTVYDILRRAGLHAAQIGPTIAERAVAIEEKVACVVRLEEEL